MHTFTNSFSSTLTINNGGLSTAEQDYLQLVQATSSELKACLEQLTANVDSIYDLYTGSTKDLSNLFTPFTNKYRSNITQTITITKDNINDNLAELFESKIDLFKVALKSHLDKTVSPIGQLVTESTIGSNIARSIAVSFNTNIPYIYYKVNVYIYNHTVFDNYVTIQLGPLVQWGFEEDNLCFIKNTGIYKEIVIGNENLSNAKNIYVAAITEFETNLKSDNSIFYLGTSISASTLKATVVRSFIIDNQKKYYFRPDYTISSNGSTSYAVIVTIGPTVHWGNTTSITQSYDLGETITLIFNRSNIAKSPILYLEKLKLIEAKLVNFISNRLSQVITSSSLGSDTVHNFYVGKTKWYYNPNTVIPEHTEDDTSINVTIGPSISYGVNPNNLDRSFTIPNNLIQSLDITVHNILNIRNLYETSIVSLKNKLQQHLNTIYTVRETADRAIGLTHISSGQRIYYKTYYTIEEFNDNENGTQIKITMGPDIEWEYDPDVIELET